MSIIIYHQEQNIDPEEVEALRRFYECDHVEIDWNLAQPIPENTLAVCKLDDENVVFHEQPESVRIIHINIAFAEMSSYLGTILGQIKPDFEQFAAKIQEFISQQGSDIFTVQDVIMYLGMNPEGNRSYFAVPSITDSLEQFGCIKEYITIFRPPVVDQQSINQPARGLLTKQ